MGDIGNSPLNYFQGLMSCGNCAPSILERKVAICYSIQGEASVFFAHAGINNGVGSVRDYVPLLHRALIDLGGFQLAILEAPSCRVYTWPNVELRNFANSIIELGINMKFHTVNSEDSSRAKMPAAAIHNSGVALEQFGLVLAQFADGTYFCGKDLSGVVAANQPLFQLSSRIVGGLTVEAMSRDLTGEQGQHGLPYLSEIVRDCAQNFPPSRISVTAAKRGTAARRGKRQ